MMDMYAMTLLGLMAAVLVLTIIGTAQAVVSNRKAFNKVVAKNATATFFATTSLNASLCVTIA